MFGRKKKHAAADRKNAETLDRLRSLLAAAAAETDPARRLESYNAAEDAALQAHQAFLNAAMQAARNGRLMKVCTGTGLGGSAGGTTALALSLLDPTLITPAIMAVFCAASGLMTGNLLSMHTQNAAQEAEEKATAEPFAVALRVCAEQARNGVQGVLENHAAAALNSPHYAALRESAPALAARLDGAFAAAARRPAPPEPPQGPPRGRFNL